MLLVVLKYKDLKLRKEEKEKREIAAYRQSYIVLIGYVSLIDRL